MANSAAQLQLVDECALALFEIGDVVVFEQLGTSTVDARSVTFLDHSLLTGGWMTLTR